MFYLSSFPIIFIYFVAPFHNFDQKMLTNDLDLSTLNWALYQKSYDSLSDYLRF